MTSQDGDEQTLADLQALADLIGLLVVSKRALSDSHARLVRTQPMNVAAEMQWHLMPPLTFASDRVVLSAMLEPAYQVSGDAFDYAVADRVLHLGIFDAMGHDTPAGVTANLAVAACRNSRRQGAGLVAKPTTPPSSCSTGTAPLRPRRGRSPRRPLPARTHRGTMLTDHRGGRRAGIERASRAWREPFPASGPAGASVLESAHGKD
ncbi:hypothetical protein [Streptomyces hygroscopicus]|uniref:hypothetical protein n=1 Tax=Streptomyces hygroscopicus TaxID=1912 RepID=UPI00369D8793